jgi:hypothetical protein
LKEEQVSEAVVVASRSADVLLQGYTAWIECPEETAVPSAARAPKKSSWLSRIFKRNRQSQLSLPAVPALMLAIEPCLPLEPPYALKFLSELERELCRANPSYNEHRSREQVGRPVLILLKEGTLAQRSHRRLAEGEADAHSPLPTLAEESPLLFGAEEIETHVALSE